MKRLGVNILCVVFFSLIFLCSTSYGATLYYATHSGRSGNPSTLWSINTDAPYTQVALGTIDARIVGLSSSGIPNVIYAADRAASNLLAIDVSVFPAAGSVVTVGPFNQDIRGLAFDSTTATLYGRDNNQYLYTIDSSTGAVIMPAIGQMAANISILAMTFDSSGILYGMSDSGQDLLYTINTTTAAISLVNPPGGPGLQQISGIFIDPETNIMYGVRRDGDEAFYSINQTDASATFLADLDGEDARALAAPLPQRVSSIPTLSEWGMIIMVLLFAGCAVMALRKKNFLQS